MGKKGGLCGLLDWARATLCAGRFNVDVLAGPAEDAAPPKTGGGMATVSRMKTGQKLPLTLQITDDKGRPARIDGQPQWELVDADKGTLTVDSADGMTATFRSGQAEGPARVLVTCDADLGEGVRDIQTEVDITIMAREATNVEVFPGEPSDDDGGSGPTAARMPRHP